MNRSTLRYFAISTIILLAPPSIASAAAGDELGEDRLKTVQVARTGDASREADSSDLATNHAQAPEKPSLSVGIALPMLNPNPTIPQVVLSERHKETCLKRVGDQLEAITLKDVEGRDVSLQEEWSDRFTVLILWSEKSVAGYEQFRRIPVDVLAKFAPHRVKVVTVNVGGTVPETQRLTGSASNKILSLVDTKSTFFQQLATEFVPRTYVIDAEGRIMWFEIEYSESTRRSLDNALTYFLQQAPAEPQ